MGSNTDTARNTGGSYLAVQPNEYYPLTAAIPPEEDLLMNLLSNQMRDLALKNGLFNLEQELELQNLPRNFAAMKAIGNSRLQNLDHDFELQYLPWGLGRKSLQNLEQEPELQNLDIRWAIIQGLAEDAFKGRPAYLQNLSEEDIEL